MKATVATMKKFKSVIIAGVGIALAMAVVIMCGLLASCSSEADAGSINASEGALAVIDETESLIGNMQDGEVPQENEEAAAESVANGQADFSTMETQSTQSSGVNALSDSNSSSPATSTGSKSQVLTSSSQSTSQRKWVEDTQQVWVEDRAAWTESVPVYGTKEVSICNVCGSDITGNTSAHGKAHMLAGEGSGHHSEVRQTVTGHNTVNHPAEGHYETRVVGGHWE